jgi:REP element-mobilizing transposase RayT
MLDDYGFEVYENNEFPLAYLITFRTYGTWLHGDERGSIRRNRKGEKETKFIPINIPLKEKMRDAMLAPAVLLDASQRLVVEAAIKEVCNLRTYGLHAANVRTNHVHAVIAAQCKPDRLADALKAYATRRLRERGLIGPGVQVWARGRSRRYLWKPRHVAAAVDYVLYGQGDLPFELVD